MTNINISAFGQRSKKEIALTFDDGPNPHATLKILAILDTYNIKATFFVIGKRCIQYPDILKQIHLKGHLVANHTYSHDTGDFRLCGEVINNIIGTTPKYIRPPFYDVSYCLSEILDLDKNIVITGEVDSKDYLDIAYTQVVQNVVHNTSAGAIIDFHDGSEREEDLKERSLKTVEALPVIISNLINFFRFVRIDKMDLVIKLEEIV